MQKKPKIGIISLTSCEGCRVAVTKLGQRLLALTKEIEITEDSYLEDTPWPESFDIVFIEGTPIRKRGFDILYEARKRADTLVALGNCADTGGIQKGKNYKESKEKVLEDVYGNIGGMGIENPEIKGVKEYVKVDFTIPGCPIDSEEFYQTLRSLLEGKKPEIEQLPVCKDCPRAGTKHCYITQKRICFGPWALGGCGSPCPTNGMPCLACRGFRKGVNISVIKQALGSFALEEEIENKLEIFGLLEELQEKQNKKNHK